MIEIKKNKKSLILLIVFSIMFLILGGTLSVWLWVTDENQQTNFAFTVEKNFSCAADGGEPINTDDISLVPATCKDADRVIKREIKVMPKITKNGLSIGMDLWLYVNEIDERLSKSENLKYVLTESSDSCSTGVIVSGSFNGISVGSKIDLFIDKIYTSTTTDTYYLWIWLDKAETDNDTMNKNFDLSLSGSCTDNLSFQPEKPVLDDEMIPVTIADDGKVTTVLEDDPSWYDYSSKKWANVVLVNNDNYKNTSGVEVVQDDILAYYVWIPRYKYKISKVTCEEIKSKITEETYPECYGPPYSMTEENKQELIDLFLDYMQKKDPLGLFFRYEEDDIREMFDNFLLYGYLEFDDTMMDIWDTLNLDYMPSTVVEKIIYTSTFMGTNETYKIDVEFEKNATLRTMGDAINTYYTHPAFWWDNDNDGATDSTEMLSGIWVAKFETTGSDSSNATILPNEPALRPLSISEHFSIARNFNKNLSTTKSNSHLIKNSEWGATVYLANSKYGVGGEVRINNYHKDGTLTGCGASRRNGAQYATCGIPYGSAISYPQSTTGNISGIFDMSGGLGEYTMGVYNHNIAKSNFTTLPESKYYDLYKSYTFAKCTLQECGGHGIGEALLKTNSATEAITLHNDKVNMTSSTSSSWYFRGGTYAHHHYFIPIEVEGKQNTFTMEYSDGAFQNGYGNGAAVNTRGSRMTIINGFGA
ncbi:MAG: hypothetical protein IJE89_05535 [Bacilli bacterium]|nr:hypothetical protein [Bacilli bacterium]